MYRKRAAKTYQTTLSNRSRKLYNVTSRMRKICPAETTKAQKIVEVKLHAVSTSALDGKNPGPQGSNGRFGEKKNSPLARIQIPRRKARTIPALRTEEQ